VRQAAAFDSSRVKKEKVRGLFVRLMSVHCRGVYNSSSIILGQIVYPHLTLGYPLSACICKMLVY
jgi:hypothetical protein